MHSCSQNIEKCSFSCRCSACNISEEWQIQSKITRNPSHANCRCLILHVWVKSPAQDECEKSLPWVLIAIVCAGMQALHDVGNLGACFLVLSVKEFTGCQTKSKSQSHTSPLRLAFLVLVTKIWSSWFDDCLLSLALVPAGRDVHPTSSWYLQQAG